MHSFHCSYKCSCGASIEWDASWEMLGAANDTDGFRIHEGISAIDVILGCADYLSTSFLLIPSLGIGIEVEDYKDSRQIEYRLYEYSKLDHRTAVTISKALFDYFGGNAASCHGYGL